MSEESSEEKSLPPSEKKLREARKKGQIAKSQDVISAVSMILLTLYIVFAWPSIMESFAKMFGGAATAASILGPGAWRLGLQETTDAMAEIIVPLYILSILAIFLGSIISNKGIVISMQPLAPDLNRLNPAKGFQKIFAVRNFVEFLKALIKSLILFSGLALAGWLGFETIMNVPLCGQPCYSEALVVVAAPVVFTALTLFFVSALIDTTVQRWLFTREMKMTQSEHKREMKEMFGDPLIRRARNDNNRDDADSGPAGKSLANTEPTLVVTAGTQLAVGLRYVPGETTAPVVVSKAKGARALILIDEARRNRAAVANDSPLAEQLYKQSRRLSFVPQAFFKDVARLLVQTR